jgi:tetratricopeptide (TPR) repeat protein
MNLRKAAVLLLCLLCLHIKTIHAAPAHTVKGVVITPDGTVVPRFSVVVKTISDKPKLVPRKQFKDGEFTIAGLAPGKYQIQISAPTFMAVKLFFDFKSEPRDTDYRIVLMHPFRNEARLTPGSAYTVSAKVLQQKIPDAAREAYLKGVNFHREGKLEEALIQYGTALRTCPKYLEALTDIGTIFLLYNRPEAAMVFLRRAQEVDQVNPIININVAAALSEQGDYGEALKIVKNMLRSQPRMALAQYFAARIHYLRKQYGDAAAYARQALENDSKMLDAVVLLINIGIEQRRYDDVREELARMREIMNNGMVTKFINEQLSTLGN